MGRAAGFIAMEASLASGDVDLLLIPEVQFEMTGPRSILDHIKNRLQVKGHCVVVVAEGAGQHVMEPTGKFDDSGNPVLPEVGQWLKRQISAVCDMRNVISYIIVAFQVTRHASSCSVYRSFLYHSICSCECIRLCVLVCNAPSLCDVH